MVSKKAFVDNIFLVIMTILGFFVLIMVNFLYGSVKDELNTHDVVVNNSLVQETFTAIETTNASHDWLFVLLFFGTVTAILITLYFLRSNPAFFIVGLIGLIVVIFLAIILRDVFTEVITSNQDWVDTTDNMPKSNYFFSNLPVIMLVIISLFLIFTYVIKNGGVNLGG